MKKRTAVILAGMLVLASMAPVYAAENPQKQNTVLTADVASTYTLTIPSDQKIAYGSVSTRLDGKLKVSGNVKPGEAVTVSVLKSNFVNQNAENSSFAFQLKSGTAEFASAEWSEAQLRAGTTEVPLTICVTEDAWKAAKAGTYKATITFTAEMK